MSLSDLIKKDGLARVATATPATLEANQALTVAEVATVAVAVAVKPDLQLKPKNS